ncbi:MAG: TVP38/TMEM64 family protein [Myxococcota bacterium]|nr:TVP38/TMEM64 family protein [Myxococcota bacterium]
MPETQTQAALATPPARRLPIGRILIGLGALVGLVALGRIAGAYVPVFAEWVEGLGFWGPLIFMLGYAVAVVAFVPASILTLAAGAIFGLGAGTAYVFVAATVGACAAFLVARYFARSWVEHRIQGNAKFAAVDREVARQGRKIVFLLRLSPAFPFNLLNYALGLTQVRFGDYALAALGMLPGTFLYVYVGKLIGDVAAVAGGAERETTAGEWAFLGVGLVATIAVVTIVTRIARQALAEATTE